MHTKYTLENVGIQIRQLSEWITQAGPRYHGGSVPRNTHTHTPQRYKNLRIMPPQVGGIRGPSGANWSAFQSWSEGALGLRRAKFIVRSIDEEQSRGHTTTASTGGSFYLCDWYKCRTHAGGTYLTYQLQPEMPSIQVQEVDLNGRHF